MTSTQADPATRSEGASQLDSSARVGILSRGYCVLASFCSSATLAMMSERDLNDLGLLPTEVRSEFPSVAIGA
jgi:hypothetical protein